MAKNKIVYDGTVLIDLTNDTVDPSVLKYGVTAHDKAGNLITGASKLFPLDPLYYDYNIGYVANGTWKYENPTKTYTDIYEVQAGSRYFITLGGNVGSRFRSMFTTSDVTQSKVDIAGTSIINVNSPQPYANISYTCNDDGYILVAKDNVGKTGIFSYVYNVGDTWI